MKKICLLLCAALLLGILLPGCSTENGEGNSSRMDNGSQETSSSLDNMVTLTFLKGGVQPLDREYWTDYIARYQLENPHVSIDYSEATWSDFDTKLNVALSAGAPPDLVGERLGGIAVRGNSGQYVDLNSYLNTMDDLDDFIDSILELGRYEGQQIAFPVYPGPILFVYNKEHFAQAGLNPERGPETWEELLQAAEILSVYDDNGVMVRCGFLMQPDSDWEVCAFMRQAGVDFADANGDPAWNDPRMLDALELIRALGDYSLRITSEQNSQTPPFLEGTASMQVLSPSSISQYLSENPDQKDNIGVFFPEKETRSVWSGCEFVSIPADSKNIPEAWSFIHGAIEATEMWTRYETANFPVVRHSLKDQYIDDDPFLNNAIFSSMEFGKGAEKTLWWLTGLKYILNTSTEVFYDQKTPEEALESNYQQFLDAIS